MVDLSPGEDEWAELVERLSEAETVVLGAHVDPDGDALGSALAVGLGLQGEGRQVSVSYPGLALARGVPVLPRTLEWLPGRELLVPTAGLSSPIDVAISFDVSSIDRLGELAKPMRSAAFFAAIDHHQTFTGFADLSIVDTNAPATAVLAVELLDRLKIALTPDMAGCIYAGISTDTGSFSFATTTAETHDLAARLLRAGARSGEIATALYDTREFAEQKLLGLGLSRAVLEIIQVEGLDSGIALAWTYVSEGDRAALDVDGDSLDLLVASLRRTASAHVAAVLKGRGGSEWRVSLRSRGDVDVGAICASLGGGGHRMAAGYSAYGALDDVILGLVGAIAAACCVGAA